MGKSTVWLHYKKQFLICIHMYLWTNLSVRQFRCIFHFRLQSFSIIFWRRRSNSVTSTNWQRLWMLWAQYDEECWGLFLGTLYNGDRWVFPASARALYWEARSNSRDILELTECDGFELDVLKTVDPFLHAFLYFWRQGRIQETFWGWPGLWMLSAHYERDYGLLLTPILACILETMIFEIYAGICQRSWWLWTP